ncbi:hypothetical protein [Undibacterium rugosum]|uniref:Uncharacterized protein n=1 Tax=Undibacterium rugosum TaxID=2762291 RepID=A0A923ICG6_9BURK|nr:hypothetical protein [Undibacterium rugosum]MBC3936885.1 hypothetical protein [Undibacterium rugosum]MBR7780087.1 hypothetical protein [Undibacterium rugosum]
MSFSLSLSASAMPAQAAAPETAPVAATVQHPVFKHAVEFSGMLGKQVVHVFLRPKKDEIDGLEGYYILNSGSKTPAKRILLAGELAGDRISLEESQDGTEVSGQWDAELKGGQLTGNWLSADGNTSLDFVLKLRSPRPARQVTAK